MLGIVVDITERKRAEETLRATKAALEFALESGPIGDWDLDLVHDTSCRSLRHDQCFGYTQPIPEAEWRLEVFVRHVHPDDRAYVNGSFREAVGALRDWAAWRSFVLSGLIAACTGSTLAARFTEPQKVKRRGCSAS